MTEVQHVDAILYFTGGIHFVFVWREGDALVVVVVNVIGFSRLFRYYQGVPV